MLLEPTRLASYIASKICHDLVSPLGAGGSALDFLGDTSSPEMREQAEQLLISGTTRGLARLQFLRYAFGSMGLSSGSADLHEAKSLVEGYVGTHTGRVEWDISAESVTFSQVRLMMNLVMLGLASLTRDGLMTIEISGHDKVDITLTATGRKARVAPDVRAALSRTEPEDGWNPRTIQPYYTTLIVDELGGNLTYETDEELVRFRATGL